MYKKTTLKNGLRIITIPMKNTRAVSVLALVGTGSKYEEKGINGISHFLEHMFFKGTNKRPTALKVAETLDEVGGNYNAFTGKELTGYWAKVDSKHLNIALDWVSDIFLNSKFEQKEINKERGVIIEEFNMYLDTPMAYIDDLWEKLLYGNQPAGWLTIGNKKNIRSFKRKDFLNYFRGHYSARNSVICVAGDIERKKIEEKIKKYFKKIRTAIPKTKLKVIEKQKEPRILIHYKKTDQAHIYLGVRAYDIFDHRRFAQAIMATILGGFMSSRLFTSIREKRGLAYYIRTLSESTTDTGCLVTKAGIDNRKIKEAIKLILKEYEKLKETKISETELRKAKDYLKGTLTLSLESSDAKASFYAGQEVLKGKISTPKEKFSALEKVTSEDVRKVAREIFKDRGLNLALIGPFKNKNEFKEILKFKHGRKY